MPRRLTTKEFIGKAMAIHGDRYDYSRVQYERADIKVEVGCPDHGIWLCHPGNHMAKKNPRGCPKCGRNRLRKAFTKPFSDFVAQANQIHDHRYEYIESTYSGSRKKMRIRCPDHGAFLQTPDQHINARSGCPNCSEEHRAERKRYSDKEINRQVTELSGGLVSLVAGTYAGKNHEAAFICKEHGQFKRRAQDALTGSNPCLKCSGGYKYSAGFTVRDIERIVRDHFGEKYEIEPFSYENQCSNITLICPHHGSFTIQFASIRRSSGCPKCTYETGASARRAAIKKQIESTKEQRFIDWLGQARMTHGEKYDYSKVRYETARRQVAIICPVHGEFRQTPGKHLKSGCNSCANEDLQGRYTDKYFSDYPERKAWPAYVYYIKFRYAKGDFYKVGITTMQITARFVLVKKAGIKYDVIRLLKTTLHKAFLIEQEIQEEYGRKSRYRPLLSAALTRDIRIGPTECFSEPLPDDVADQYFIR